MSSCISHWGKWSIKDVQCFTKWIFWIAFPSTWQVSTYPMLIHLLLFPQGLSNRAVVTFWLKVHVLYWCYRAVLWWDPWLCLKSWAPFLTKLFPSALPLIAPLTFLFLASSTRTPNSLCIRNFPLFQKYKRMGGFWVSSAEASEEQQERGEDHLSLLLPIWSWIFQKLLSSFLCEVILLKSSPGARTTGLVYLLSHS